MRLVQLALKLGVAQHEIVSFLREKGVDIQDNGNAKVEDEQLALVTSHFGVDEVAIPEQNAAGKEANDTVPEPAQKREKPQKTSLADSASEETDVTHKQSTEKVEVIRAKKIKLEGIKVVGKIDLPEPVKKSKKKTSATTGPKTVKPPKRENRKNGRKTRPPKKSESYQQKLKREEKEARRKKRQLENQIKEQKKRHYQKKITPVKPQKPKKKSTKKITPPPAPKKVVRHTNPVRRLWDWLNGRYD